MIIKSLTLSNFRQFKDEETIKFSENKDSNITLILGDNTSGKTTILQAFLWCLYGRAKFSSEEKLFNEQTANLMNEHERTDVRVSIELEHAESDYIIERSQECMKRNGTVALIGNSELKIVRKGATGETINVPKYELDNTINEILPGDLSEYFFYDTERFGNVTEKKDVTEAVKGLLGLTVLENAIVHLGTRRRSGTVINTFYEEINVEGNKELQVLNEQIKTAEDNVTRFERMIDQFKSEKESYKNKKDDKEEELKGYEETEDIKKHIDSRRKEKSNKENELEDTQGRFLKDFQRGTLSYFISPLVKESQKFLGETEVNDEFISGMDSRSIDDIIERGYCICGTEINKQSPQYDNLQKTLEYIPPQSLGQMVNNYENLLSSYLSDSEQFYESIDDTYHRLSQINSIINNLDQEISMYEDRVGEFEKTKNIKEEIDYYKSKIRELDESELRTDQDRKHAQKKLETLQKKVDKLIQLNIKNKELLTLLKYSEEVLNMFNTDYDKRNDRIRVDLEERVNEYFKQIYHGNRFVRIEQGFRVVLYSKSDEYNIQTDESTGLETVKNFAFIAGLVDLTKEKLDENKSKYKEDIKFGLEEEYPLVLDAPFSNVDEKHVVNISKVLPSVAGQLILIVMDKDWNYAAEELKYRVGAQYRLDKKSEIHTKIIKE